MCIFAILCALSWNPLLQLLSWLRNPGHVQSLAASFIPARWAPIVHELLGNSGTRASSWNPARLLAKHYPSATGLSLTNRIWVSFKQRKTRNLPDTQANLFANVPLISCMESCSEAAKLYFYYLSFPFNFCFWMYKECVLVTSLFIRQKLSSVGSMLLFTAQELFSL